MNASPVTHAGSERPGEEEVEAARHRAPGHDADAEDEDEVERDQQVVDPVGVESKIVPAARTIEPPGIGSDREARYSCVATLRYRRRRPQIDDTRRSAEDDA